MNTATAAPLPAEEMIAILLTDPTTTRSMAEDIVCTWRHMDYRHHNGQPVTVESIRRMARPSRGAIKRNRPVASRMTTGRMDAHRRYWTGIE